MARGLAVTALWSAQSSSQLGALVFDILPPKEEQQLCSSDEGRCRKAESDARCASHTISTVTRRRIGHPDR